MKKILLLSALLLSVACTAQPLSRSRLLTQNKYTLNQRQLPPDALKDSLWNSVWMPATDGTPLTSSTGVPSSRQLTINGVAFNLSANRTWTVGDLLASASYSNPSFIASLAWSKITGTPTTVAGYGITDAIPYSGATQSININTQIFKQNGTSVINGYIELSRTGLLPSGGAANTLRIISGTAGQFIFATQNAGSTDGFRRIFAGTLTGHRTYTLQNADGTLAFTSDISAITNSYVPYNGAAFDVALGTKKITAANLLSGQYTPVLTNANNITASTAFVTQYYRVGNMVTVFGRVLIDPILAITTPTELEISLPIASTFGFVEELSGTAVTTDNAATAAKVEANGTNTASIMFNAINGASSSWSFTFSYIVQ